ncbi:hypothetical protein [Agrobacterium tumefaciens]|uniref:hypothetical protein n=1 Tax=Agrobacterium tumefaciens TaxID=358 RepID=UPI003BA1E7F0
MASDRKAAKQAIEETSKDDPELDEAISGGHSYQLKLAQENNRHREVMRRSEMGVFGRLFGSDSAATTSVAFIAMVSGVAGTAFCWIMAGNASVAEITTFWSTQAERALAFSGGALAYLFGKGAK